MRPAGTAGGGPLRAHLRQSIHVDGGSLPIVITRQQLQQIAEGISAIIETIHAKAPSAQVLLHAIFPRGPDAKDPWRKRCVEINKQLPALAEKKHAQFIDVGAALMNADDTISKEVMPDLLHLSAKGYEIWARALDAKLNELLGEK